MPECVRSIIMSNCDLRIYSDGSKQIQTWDGYWVVIPLTDEDCSKLVEGLIDEE